MKQLIIHASVILLTCALQAQVPNPVLNPKVQTSKLQEWWRVDSKGYGIKGATWLERFYNGNGALVVSTPTGVQTWQLRFPGDTENVFTWKAGDANIKTGDFNHDGTTDYVDGNGVIYLGGANGSMPAMTSLTTGKPDVVGDFNDDGYDDVFSLNPAGANYGDVGMCSFGSGSMTDLHQAQVHRNGSLDTSWIPFVVYRYKQQLRIVCRSRFVDYPTDGYSLYGVSFKQGNYTPTLTELHRHIRSSDSKSHFTTGIGVSYKCDSGMVMATAELIGLGYFHSNLVCYDLSSDSILKVNSYRCDSVVQFDWLNSNPASSESHFILTTKAHKFPLLEYSIYPVSKTLERPLSTFQLDYGQFCLMSGWSINSSPSFCIAQHFYNGKNDEDHLLVLSMLDSTTNVSSYQSSTSCENQLLVFPNPSEGIGYVDVTEMQSQFANIDESLNLVVTDILGVEVLRTELQAGKGTRFDISSCSSGVYRITLFSGSHEADRLSQIGTGWVVVQH